ncbi:MAG TPA: hypothetical protein VGG48_07025 [Rhizomicrobium sp.]|jgi:hypothetical protein
MAQAATAPVKYAGRSYIVEMGVVTALYVAAVWARPWLIAQASNHDLKIAATVLPALPIWGMLLAVWRYFNRIDEFERLRLLETLAIAFGIGSCLICTYSFLADAGLPQLAITWAWPTLAVSWALTGAIQHIARR